MKIGKRETVRRTLKALRATVGLSQMDVAERMGISHNHYWRIENWYDQPTDRERASLAKVLGVDEAVLPWQAVEAQAS